MSGRGDNIRSDNALNSIRKISINNETSSTYKTSSSTSKISSTTETRITSNNTQNNNSLRKSFITNNESSQSSSSTSESSKSSARAKFFETNNATNNVETKRFVRAPATTQFNTLHEKSPSYSNVLKSSSSLIFSPKSVLDKTRNSGSTITRSNSDTDSITRFQNSYMTNKDSLNRKSSLTSEPQINSPATLQPSYSKILQSSSTPQFNTKSLQDTFKMSSMTPTRRNSEISYSPTNRNSEISSKTKSFVSKSVSDVESFRINEPNSITTKYELSKPILTNSLSQTKRYESNSNTNHSLPSRSSYQSIANKPISSCSTKPSLNILPSSNLKSEDKTSSAIKKQPIWNPRDYLDKDAGAISSTTTIYNRPTMTFQNNINTPSTKSIAPPTIQKPDAKNIENNVKSISSITNKPKKGYVVIFNQESFQNDFLSIRQGTEQDVRTLKKTFQKFNFKTIIHNNCTLQKIDKEIHNIRKKDFSDYSLLMIIILSHGEQDEMLYAYDERYHLSSTIINPIVTKNTTLADKPKFFIIQACRGAKDPPEIERDSKLMYSTSPLSNLIKFFSTYEDYYSYRNKLTGSFFIQELCKVINENVDKDNVYQMFQKVTKELSTNRDKKFQVPTLVSTLTDDIYLRDFLK